MRSGCHLPPGWAQSELGNMKLADYIINTLADEWVDKISRVCGCGCDSPTVKANKFVHGHNARASVGIKCLISDCQELRQGRYCLAHKKSVYAHRSYPYRKGWFTTEEFIARAKVIHGNAYDYSKTRYVKAHRETIIICATHGEFKKKPAFYLLGQGCPACSARLLTQQEFIERCKKRYADRFDYSQTFYIGNTKPVTVKCQIHGQFVQIAGVHLNGNGCPYCSGKRLTHAKSLAVMFPDISKEFSPKNPNSSESYSAFSNRKVWWNCLTCKYEWQSAIQNRTRNHAGCPACAGRIVTDNNRLSTVAPDIAAEWYQPLNGKITTDQVSIGSDKKFCFKCTKCENLWVSTISHRYNGRGCPKCRESKGERRLAELLVAKNLSFERQKAFPALKGMKFDFAVSMGNGPLLIEYYGEQHYKPFRFKGADRKFQQGLKNDKIKQEFCFQNKLPLLIISYKEFDSMDDTVSRFLEVHS